MDNSKYMTVKLYYPNQWRKNLGSLISSNDKQFNWFLCSQKYRDPKSNRLVIKISQESKFYEETTGISYSVKKSKTPIILVMTSNPLETELQVINKYGYHGIAVPGHNLKSLDTMVACDSPVCLNTTFIFKSDILTPNAISPIIQYVKTNWDTIKRKVPDIPTPTDIDNAIANGYECSVVCKVLYDYLKMYWSKTQE